MANIKAIFLSISACYSALYHVIILLNAKRVNSIKEESFYGV